LNTSILVESRDHILELTELQAAALRQAGVRLASRDPWWGDEAPPTSERSVIRCQPTDGGSFVVRAVDVVGVIGCGDRQLVVKPKIPIQHFVYLLERAGWLPRIDWTKTTLESGVSLWDLIAAWFVGALESLLRRDLVRDYQRHTDSLPVVRGSIDSEQTAAAFYSGRLAFACEFDEFTYDTAPNRVLKAAARQVSSDAKLPWDLRRRAIKLSSRMEAVGELAAGDLFHHADTRHKHYTDALILATHVLRSTGRLLAEGRELAWAFLVRTPPLIEAGVRQVLKMALPDVAIRKARLSLGNSGVTVNPDILIDDGVAVADVKYKLCDGEWIRGDLYEVIAFASAYRTNACAIVDFRPSGVNAPERICVGDVQVEHLSWAAREDVQPTAAASQLVHDARMWLQRLSDTAGGMSA
jgi:5-methylcytosine-specific restriction enzyme subunit McrC